MIWIIATILFLCLAKARGHQEALTPTPTPSAKPALLHNGKYELRSKGIRAQFIPYAASLTNLFIEDKHGVERDIVLGFDNATFYSSGTAWHPHLNGIPGRYANRIKNGTFEIDGTTYHTSLNDHGGLDTLHGGTEGWDWRNWTFVSHSSDSITFSLHDPDGKEGFPGAVTAQVTYSLGPHHWRIKMTAQSTTQKTPIMLTNHGYWNLDGFQNPDTALVLNHTLYMPDAKRRTVGDNIQIPTGEIAVNDRGGAFDFWSRARQLGEVVPSSGLLGACGSNCTGLDNCFILDREREVEQRDEEVCDWEKEPVVTLASLWSGIRLDVFTNQHAVQVYSCNNMNGTFPMKATQGFLDDAARPRVVEKYGCVVLEMEDWIDGINNPSWGRDKYQIFGPGDEYVFEARYDFSVAEAG